jgi:prepilin-type N-terminal cleavage/methylation domain-containing protein
MSARGFSLSEIVVTVSVLGILATIVIITMNGSFSAAKDTIASHRQETVNQAVSAFMTSFVEINYTAKPASTQDELFIIAALRFRDPNELRADAGTPYIQQDYNPKGSTSAADYRLRWTGRRFELLRPGQEGVGLKIEFDGSDFGGSPPSVDPRKVFGR